MAKLRPPFLVLILLLICAGLAAAQRPKAVKEAGEQSGRDDIIRLGSDLVMVDVVVTDANGDYIRGLGQEDFEIFHDNVKQKIDFFEVNDQAELTRPLAVVFALDISGSLEPEQVAQQQHSARKFVELVRKGSLFSVLAFNYEVKILQDFTNDPQKIQQAFARASKVGGSTRIYDGVDRAITMLKRAPQFREGRRLRRVVVLITDGFDSSSIINAEEVIRRANAANVTVYAITIPNYIDTLGGKRRRSLTLLDISRLVPATGGIDFSADSYDFAPIFRAIAEELKSSYTLAYYPPESSRNDGKFHRISVSTVRSGLTLRVSKEGYLASK